MQLILSKQCESLTGSLGSGYGYAVQKRKSGYYAVRNTKGIVPPDGHLRFILKCAELAQMKLHIVDVQVPGWEIYQAVEEAGYNPDDFSIQVSVLYNATRVFNFKQELKL